MGVRPLPGVPLGSWAMGLLLPFLSGCSRPLAEAEKLARNGLAKDAAEAFEAAARREPEASWAAEALWQAGRQWQAAQVCDRSRPAFEELARRHPDHPWPLRAMHGLLSCPDYYPTEPGWTWTFGDSQTGGQNMRQEVRSLPGQAHALYQVVIYAGERIFSNQRKEVRKVDWRVEEVEGQGVSPAVVLRFPFGSGNQWTSKRGDREIRFRIEAVDASVRVRAGEFKGCVKVREEIQGFPSWTYFYYAPGVGKVLTATAGEGFETPTVELLKFQKPERGAS